VRNYDRLRRGTQFLQPDPIGTKDDLNLYGYVHEDPLDGSDPDGLADCKSTPSACTGATAYAGQNLTRAEQVRAGYTNAAGGLSPTDSAGRAGLSG
jgi:uncharacterized protein RhaS with RHS repeats